MMKQSNKDPPPLEPGTSKRMPIITHMITVQQKIRRELGFPDCPTKDLEKCSFLIYDSMEAPTRNFHGIDHLFDLSKGADPIQIAAIAFHDVVYYQIDGGLNKGQREYLHDVIVEKDGEVYITNEKLEYDLEIVMDVFGYKYGQVLDPYKGMNEFLSAVIASRVYTAIENDYIDMKLSRVTISKITACIEATIPFRGPDEKGRSPPEVLYDRLVVVNQTYDMGMNEDDLVLAVQRSADLGNRDLENFSWTDQAAFLSNTWKLLSESNVALRNDVYYISEMSFALKKMVGFFEFLDPETIYFSFRDPEAEAVVKEKTAKASKNIGTALIYMRCKYLALSALSAVAELSGGDAPISLFMGDLPTTSRRVGSAKIEDFLDMEYEPKEGTGYSKDVLQLLREGRDLESQFDSRKSPLGDFLYARIGDGGLKKSIKYAVHPMDKTNALLLLGSIPTKPLVEFLSACSEIAPTRREGIAELLDKFSETSDVQSDNIVEEGKCSVPV